MASESTSSFGSHNPFRKKTATLNTDPGHAGSSSPISSATTPSDFARALSSLPKTTHAPPPPVSFARKKPVKKVRVQSPPPSSPESAGAPHTYPKYPLPPRDPDDDSSSASVSDEELNGEREDPFQNEAPPLPEEALAGVGVGVPGSGVAGLGILNQAPAQQPYTGRAGPPPNPFQKTLEDIERDAREGGQGSADGASAAGKTGMDVEAFKRLLLTGQGPARSQAGDGGSTTETSSTSRQSILEATHASQETPRTSHEISEPDGDEDSRSLIPPPPQPKRSGSRKKPPPPPATRHGKLIKVEPRGKEGRSSAGPPATSSPTSPGRPSSSSSSPTDVNKPLPAPPERAAEDDAGDSIFDKEAAGKIPEVDIDPDADVVPPPRPPTPPNASHSSSAPVQDPPQPPSSLPARRPSAPPPRRPGHARGESSSNVGGAAQQEDATTPPRSSLESQMSRSSSLRLSLAAPAPPPPRRQVSSGGGGHNRQSPSVSTSPSSPYTAVPPSPGSDVGAKTTHPPVPPPQRNTSLRKSASSSSSTFRSAKPAAPPPPPRPRTRGSSKGSVDGVAPPGLDRTRSAESVRVSSSSGGGFGGVNNVAPVAEEQGAEDEALKAMLADLDALQREVDAAAREAAGGG